jgi:hypothetical protein
MIIIPIVSFKVARDNARPKRSSWIEGSTSTVYNRQLSDEKAQANVERREESAAMLLGC